MKINFFLLLFLTIICILFPIGCSTPIFDGCLKGEGAKENRTITLPDLTGVKLGIDGEIILYEGEKQEIRIEAESNVADRIVEDSDIKNGIWEIDINGCSNTNGLKFHITIPDLEYVGVSGDGQVRTDTKLTGLNTLEAEVSGDGDFNLNLDSLTQLNIKISGESTMSLAGDADKFNINIDGDGTINAFSFDTKSCNINIDGKGNCQVLVSESLTVDINGDGDICYKGNPVVTSTISGTGEVRDCN